MEQNAAITLLPTIITGGFSLLMLVFQWSLKRNLDHQDERAKKQDERSDKIERGIDGLRSEIGAMSHNLQSSTARLDTKGALLERDLGTLQGVFSKLDARVDRLAEYWRTEHDKLDERTSDRIEKAMSDVLDTIDELKKTS